MTNARLEFLRSVIPPGFKSEDEYETYLEAKEYEAACVACRDCGDVWHPDGGYPFAEWSGFHAGCAVHGCPGCGEPTQGPDYCFTCFHEPFGIGWQQEHGARY